jgi:hypothetical protein
MQEPTGEFTVPVAPEPQLSADAAAEQPEVTTPPMITVPESFVTTTEAYSPVPMVVTPHEPNREVIPSGLSPEETAAKLANLQAVQRMAQAAADAHSAQTEAQEAAKNQPL